MGGNAWYLVVLSLAHLVTDLHQGGMPALLPLLKQSYGLTYGQVGMIQFVLNITSSVIQPLFGYVSDRVRQWWLLPAGPALAAAGLALAGHASGYQGILQAAALCGLGVALFHPEAARAARLVAGGRRATAMAVFSVGGNAGFALGPVLALALVGWFGLKGLTLLLVPAALIAVALLASIPGLARHEHPAGRGAAEAAAAAGPTNWWAEALLVGVVGARSWLQLGLVTLMPFYYMERTGGHGEATGLLLFVFLGAGALGTVVGGPLADRVGTRTVLIGSMAVLIPIHWALVHGPAWATLPLLALAGFAVVATFSITLVLSQDFMPRYVAVASGLNTGLSIGLGGLGVAVLSSLADRWGLLHTLEAMVVLPVLGLVLSLLVPVPERERQQRARQARAATT
ncbi:MAG: MFS transporter [Bacillota bacterium]|nr:MAG: MFS transporter [Bacillota bacterium]